MVRTVLLCGAACMIVPTIVQAQTTGVIPPNAETSNSAVVGQAAPGEDAATPATSDTAIGQPEGASEIVVTGSRIVTNGFQQPTPVTVLGDAEINRQAPPTIATYLNKLPSFGVSTSSRNPAINVAGGGVEFLNLRNLGPLRTLVILDNRRVVEATTGGGVDTVTLPFGLIKRVEVVTGGASAAWGSDAVAGVVNFVLDRDFSGIGLNLENSITERGDSRYTKWNVTAGSDFADSRGHVVAEFDFYHQPRGVDLGTRDFFKSRAVVNNPAFAAGNGQPRQITVTNTAPALVSPGGIITSGPLRGTQFVGPDAIPLPYNFGIQSGLVQYGGDVDNTVGRSRSISTPLTYGNAFAHVDYDVSDKITAYVEGFYGKSIYKENGYLNYLRQGNLPIAVDNAFLNPAIRSRLVALGQTSFLLGKDTVDQGPPTSYNERDVWRAVVGVDGKFGDTWKWHAYYTRGEVTARLYAENNTIVGNFINAVDAVRNPATGAIVCRSTLTNPGNGCIPINVFGEGVTSSNAYTHGTAFQRSNVQLDVVSADASGSLFTLPAGDVSVAFGADYIRNEASQTQDAIALARRFAVQNFQPFSGKRDIKEGFVEAVVPLIHDTPLLQKLELNGAARITDYSTSGSVTTWKVGVSNQIADGLRVRGTYSRDVRAPTLADLFSGGVFTQQPVFDPFTQRTYAQLTNAQGNPDLDPERAKTLTGGFVFSPRFVPGLALSVDYYRIKLSGAIASITAAQELQFCFEGQTFYCQFIQRDASQAITSIRTVPFNAAALETQGWDFELSYRHRIGNGQINLRTLANYVPKFTIIDPTGNVTDAAGQVADLNPGQPKLKANLIATYENGPGLVTLNARYLGTAKLQNNWRSGVDVDDNSVNDYITFDLTGQYRIEAGGGVYTLTFGIDNLFDRDPIDLPVIPGTVQYSAPGLGGRFDLYDPLGRTFRVGLRAKF